MEMEAIGSEEDEKIEPKQRGWTVGLCDTETYNIERHGWLVFSILSTFVKWTIAD